jgi:hypothetical protein
MDTTTIPAVETNTIPTDIDAAARAAASKVFYKARLDGTPVDEAQSLSFAAFTAVASGEQAPIVQPPGDVAPGVVDPAGKARAGAGLAAGRKAGFAMMDPIYDLGMRVIDVGVENARRSRLDHDAKPTVAEACTSLADRIKGENRRQIPVKAGSIRMAPDGKVLAASRKARPLTYRAFEAMVSRLGYGGVEYLARCPAELRAANVNGWRKVLAKEDPQRQVRLRVRNGAEGEEVFAVVSKGYTVFDADKIAEAIKLASPADARGAITYDPNTSRTRIEVLFHSDVQPKHYVAGESFKAGVIVRSDDTGAGGVRVEAAIWQNLCLNLIVLNKASLRIASIRHAGGVKALAEKFRAAFDEALGSLGYFLDAWGYACEEDVRARLHARGVVLPSDPEEVLWGIFNGILERELVTIPGDRVKAIEALVRCWRFDESGATKSDVALRAGGITRAAIVNSFTRFCHTELVAGDPFVEDEIQRAAGALLWSARGDGGPDPLPFQEVTTAPTR